MVVVVLCRSRFCFVWKCVFEIAMQCYIYTNMVLCGIYHVYTLGFHHQVSMNLSEFFLNHDMSSLIFSKIFLLNFNKLYTVQLHLLTILSNKILKYSTQFVFLQQICVWIKCHHCWSITFIMKRTISLAPIDFSLPGQGYSEGRGLWSWHPQVQLKYEIGQKNKINDYITLGNVITKVDKLTCCWYWILETKRYLNLYLVFS